MPKTTTRTKKTKTPTRRTSPKKISRAALPPALRAFRFDAESPIDPGSWAHLEAAESDDENKLPSFSMTAYTGGIMQPQLGGIGYFGRGVVLDLKGWKFVPGQVPINYQHNRSDPVGHCHETSIDNQVKAAGVLSIPGESRTKITEGAKNGFRWRPSVEGRPDFDHVERIEDKQTVTVNGRTLRGPFLLLRRGEFGGIGFVTTAGDSMARANVTANFTPLGMESDIMNFEQFLAAAGVDPQTATDEQLATLQAAFDAQYGEHDPADTDTKPKPTKKPAKVEAGGGPVVDSNPAVDATDPVKDENARLAANRQRVSTITDLCAAADNPTIKVGDEEIDLCAHAIETSMNAKDVELHILRNSAPKGPAIHSSRGEDTQNIEAMTAAVLLASDIPLDSPHFTHPTAVALKVPSNLRAGINTDQRQKLLEAAHKYGKVNMIDLARDCLKADGKHAPRNDDDLLEAASSSGSLHKVYQHTVGASLLVGYREQAGTLHMWTGTDEVDGVGQERQRFREDAIETLGFNPNNGEADHLGQSAHYETMQTDSYTGQREIGEEDFLNNNLGLLARTPRKMGEAARRTEENLGYATLLSNPTMKSTNRALFNTTDGTQFATRPLTIANASLMIASMMEQMDGEAALDLMAKYALVPAQLYDTARKVYQSPMISNDSGEGSVNPVSDHGVQPIACNRLGTGVRHPKTKVFHAGSDINHYLVADGVEVAVRVYLRGRGEAPRLRVSPLTQGRWGWNYDIKHIVGFAFLTTRGIFRADGTPPG